MSIFSNFKKIFLPNKTKTFLDDLDDDFDYPSRRSFFSDYNKTKFLYSYSKSVYVYACVSRIAESVSAIDFKLFKILNNRGEVEEILSHPILDLLYRVNPFYTKEEFIQTDVINRKLSGDSFILKVRNNKNVVVELWNIRPDLITIVEDEENFIKYYEIVQDGKTKRIDKNDIIHIKYPSPLSYYLGMSPVLPAEERIEIEEFANNYQRNFFINNARPDGIIEVPTYLNPIQVKELIMGWEKRHKGDGKSSRLGVLTNGAKYNQISLSQKEMDYIESMKFTRDDILVAFKVPKPIVAILDDVNRANSLTAQQIFIRETIIPEMRLLVNKLNEELIIPEFGEEYYLDFVDPTPEDRELKLQELQAGIDKWITINEARKMFNLPAITGGDVLFRPLTDNIIEAEVEKTKLYNIKSLHGRRALKIKNELKEKIYNDNIIKKNFSRSLFKDTEKRKQYSEYVIRDIENKKNRMRQLVVRLANQERDEVIKNFTKERPKTKREIKKLLNKEEEENKFIENIFPLYVSIFQEAGDKAMKLLRIDKPFDIHKSYKKINTGKEINRMLKERAKLFAHSVIGTTLDKLADSLSVGIEEGKSIPELKEIIKDVYREFSDYRSETIARTETNAVVNEAHIEAYRQSEVVEGKEWVATLDDRVRPEHLAIDGEIVELDKPFSNNLMYPCEPNCRCTIAPVVINLSNKI
ncbi:MAG TPA: phage portal protein [bacterium]|nr:phage portal protein [bacterium]